jgi:hypothetical protein
MWVKSIMFKFLSLSVTSARDSNVDEEQISSGTFFCVLCKTDRRPPKSADENFWSIKSQIHLVLHISRAGRRTGKKNWRCCPDVRTVPTLVQQQRLIL